MGKTIWKIVNTQTESMAYFNLQEEAEDCMRKLYNLAPNVAPYCVVVHEQVDNGEVSGEVNGLATE